MEKVIIAFIICIIVCGCSTDKEKFSEFSPKDVIDSVRCISTVNNYCKTVTNGNDIRTIKKALSNSYRVNQNSIMKLPPYTGTMTLYIKDVHFSYKVFGDIFVSEDNTLYKSPINLSWTINSFGGSLQTCL